MLYINDHIDNFDLEKGLAQVSPERREYALRYRKRHDQCLCVAAYMLLREGLAKEYGITDMPVFTNGHHGKPQLLGHPDIHFNISHCDEAAACIISDHPVGIDVESIKPFDHDLAAETMNEKEIRDILSSPNPSISFTRLWTMKESLLKLTGEGITNNLHNLLNDSSNFIFTIQEFISKHFVLTICEMKK